MPVPIVRWLQRICIHVTVQSWGALRLKSHVLVDIGADTCVCVDVKRIDMSPREKNKVEEENMRRDVF